jgi:rfaE bifunctional protein kinase chain/domain/rfaE bifunctional protein nucleotidyltransferase chain/domain
LRAVGGGSEGDLVEAFSSVRAVTVGEAMLDVYVRGAVSRLSPEGPFPVVDVGSREATLGGAANVAANLAALGADVGLVSVIGADPSASELVQLAVHHGIDTAGVIQDPERVTLTKTRIVGEGRPIARLDEGSTGPLDLRAQRRLASALEATAAGADVVVLADYRYGIVNEAVLAWLEESRPRPLLVVDSKDLGRFRLLCPEAVTSNYGEVLALVGVPGVRGGERVEHIQDIAGQILEATGAAAAAVTLDVDGVVVVQPGREPLHLPASQAGEEACGAGDTFTAVMALALAADGEPAQAADLAQQAAAVVVSKPGTAVCSIDELRQGSPSKLCDLDALADITERHRAAGRTIVFTNGCFDVLHAGHVASLAEAASMGDVLIVALNGDASVAHLKGPGRPVNPLVDRAAVLAGLSVVDHIVAFDEDSPVGVLSRLRPDVYCKGGDYRGRWIPEMDLVKSWNGRMYYTALVPDRSTTAMVERVRRNGSVGLEAAR